MRFVMERRNASFCGLYTPFVVFGKYIFFCGIVSVYQIVMIIFFCQDSAEGENRYGASPKYEEEPPCVPPEERKE